MMYAQDWIQQHIKKARLGSEGNYWNGCCEAPGHSDSRPSLRINADTGHVTCQGCGWSGWLDDYAQAAGILPLPPRRCDCHDCAICAILDKRDGIEPAKKKANNKSPISNGSSKPKKKPADLGPPVAEHIYYNPGGERHMKVVKYADKTFHPYRWVGGEWVLGISKTKTRDEHPRLAYNLHKITAAHPDEEIYWCEGEKDADALTDLGLLATTSPSGSKQADKLQSYEAFKGRSVTILPDNDIPGEHYGKAVSRQLLDAESRVKVCYLPGLGPRLEKNGKDVSDWLAGGRTKQDLVTTIQEHAVDVTPEASKPDVQTDWRDVRDVADEVLGHLANCDLFNRGGELVQLVRRDGLEPARLKGLDRKELLAYLCRHMAFHTKVKTGTKACSPPDWLAGLILDSLSCFPSCRRVTEFPFVNKDGELVTQEGLDASTATYLLPLYPDLQIPEKPTAAEAQESARWLGHDFLGDFPFAQDYHRTHAVTALIQPFAMAYLDDQAPLMAVSATTMGTGKTRLCRTIGYVSSTTGPEMITENNNPQHFETAAMSVLRDAPTSILLDNVKTNLDHVWLQGLLSAPTVNYRLMATNTVVKVRNPQLWLVSANNPNWNEETRRRTCPIDLDPKMETPWTRRPEEFRIPDIERYAQAERRQILQHIFTILQYWRSQGRPLSSDCCGSFERWARVMGGIIALTGLPGFLQNMKEADANLDQEVLEWRALLDHWYGLRSTKDGQWLYPGEVLGWVASLQVLVELLDGKTDGAKASAMGRALTRIRGRVFGSFRVVRKQGAKGYQYAVERIDRGEGGEPGGGGDDEGGPPRGGGLPPGDLADHLPTFGGKRSAARSPTGKGIAASADHADLNPHSMRARKNSPPPVVVENKVGKVGMVGRVENDMDFGEFRGEVTELQRSAIFLLLKARRISYRLRGQQFGGSENPKWPREVRPFIESGRWIPPNDVPWDSTLALGPPDGWVFAGDAASSAEQIKPARASPPEEEDLGELLGVFFEG